jgi:sterol desaturase/sphingolipid hydroxylase (fatty acid hydroxylase superfamily)
MFAWFLSLSPFTKLAIIPYFVYLFTYWFVSGFFFLVDLILERYGTLKSHKLQPKALIDGKMDWDKYYKTAKYVLWNQVFITLPMSIASYPFWKESALSPVLPSLFMILRNSIISVIIQDILFFSFHYTFHNPMFYGKIHKMHHEWIAPIACSGNYNHPLEHALVNMLPAVVGPMLTGMHITTFILWTFLEAVTVTVTHSDYNWWFLCAQKHDDHHKHFNCNYGVLYFSDYMFRTIYPKKIELYSMSNKEPSNMHSKVFKTFTDTFGNCKIVPLDMRGLSEKVSVYLDKKYKECTFKNGLPKLKI